MSTKMLRALRAVHRKLTRLEEQQSLLIAERDQLICDAFADGESGPVIAEAAGLKQARVYQIRDGRRA